MPNVSVTQPRREVLRRMDLARKALVIGHSPAAVQKVTGLSPYVLSILAVPEKDLRKMVEEEGRRERDEAFAEARKEKRKERPPGTDGRAQDAPKPAKRPACGS